MKFFTLVFLFISLLSFGQKAPENISYQLQTLYTQNALYPDNSITYDPNTKVLTLSGYRINVTPDTHVKAEIDRTDNTQRNRIVFYFQNNTYVAHKDRLNERHAQLSVPMKTKKACKEFKKLFTKLGTG